MGNTMSTIQSSTVSKQFESQQEAASRAIDLAPSVAAVLAEKTRPYLEEGEVLPDLTLQLKLIGRWLRASSEFLGNSDHNRRHLRNIEKQRRQTAREKAGELRDTLVEVRFLLDRTLDKKVSSSVFEGRSDLSKLRSPVLERVSARLLSLLEDPKMGWDQLADVGRRAAVQYNRERLQSRLAGYLGIGEAMRAERSALVLSKGNFDRDLQDTGLWLRRSKKWLAGFFHGAGFEREAADLALRRRAAPKPQEGGPPDGKAAVTP